MVRVFLVHAGKREIGKSLRGSFVELRLTVSSEGGSAKEQEYRTAGEFHGQLLYREFTGAREKTLLP
jgi:hypothetical protein